MNKQKVLVRAIPAVLACLASGYAAASGFQLFEQNASGIGNSYAGSAAVAENASTVFFNPAGMTQLEGRNVSAGVAAIQTTFKFNNSASSTGSLSGGNNDGGGTGYVPNAYFSMPVAKDIYLGLGVGAPFGLMTDYNGPWTGAAQSIKFDVKTMNVNPSIAWRASDKVSLGFGLDWQKITAEYKRIGGTGLAPTGLPAPYPAAINISDVTSVLKIDDNTWGWNAGVLFTLSPMTKVGISYRSAIKYNLTGNVTVTSDGTAAGATAVTILNAAGSSANVKADVKLPDTWIFSAAQTLNDKWDLLGDLSWTGWSSIPKIDIIYTSGPKATTAPLAQSLATDFRDTWRAALGTNYKYSENVKLKFGVAYDQTPVKAAATRMVSLPDNNRTWLSFGVQWQPSKGSALDVGVTRLFLKDADINNDQRSALRGLVNGTYSDSAWIVGAQYSVSF